ncbi:hypothetical protein F4694_005690 [Bacillus niacini]|uniref:Uncharacterized protein n=1 Tax=Neobacillus niacini TaxID=86668 RepID=A0A852TPG4_9BACI|nr:hypothetical protein [Neobacillus niacini]
MVYKEAVASFKQKGHEWALETLNNHLERWLNSFYNGKII